MRISRALLFSSLLPLALSSCGNGSFSGENPTGTGPFDSNGNYVEAWADTPSKWNGRSVQPKPTATPTTTTPALASNTSTQVVQRTAPASSPTTTTRVVTQQTPKPKPVAKPKPKPKPPATVYHSVRKGDTLYGLAKRYGTTVSKIQRANGISGSTIRIGQRLKIAR